MKAIWIRYHCGGNAEAGRTESAREAATWRGQGWHVERWFARFDRNGEPFQVTTEAAEARSWRKPSWLKAALLGAVLALIGGSASAGPNPIEDGFGFMERCSTAPDNTMQMERCAAYIAGLADAVADFRLLGMLPACPQAAQMTYGTMRKGVIAYLKRNPARLQDEILFVLVSANDAATGCETGGAFGPRTSKF